MGRRLELEGLELGLASGSGLGLVVWPGRVVEPAPHRSEDRPLHAERIRRPWEARKSAAMGKVVGLGLVAGRGRLGEWGGKTPPRRGGDKRRGVGWGCRGGRGRGRPFVGAGGE